MASTPRRPGAASLRALDASRDMGLAERTLRRGVGSHIDSAYGDPRSASAYRGGADISDAHPGLFAAEQFSGMHGGMGGVPGGAPFNPIYPMNVDVTAKLLQAVDDPASGVHGSAPTVNLSPDALLKLQLDVSDYIGMLDNTLRSMFTQPNARLAARIRETSDVPLTFLYFRTQQKMLKLTGDLSVQRERDLLAKLANILDQ